MSNSSPGNPTTQWFSSLASSLAGERGRPCLTGLHGSTAGFALIRGRESDFLGQYHRNSHAIVSVRYSF